MAKLAQLAGLSAVDAYKMTDFQANYLAMAVGETLMREALNNPKTLSPAHAQAVRSRTERIARGFREQNDAADNSIVAGGPLGPPPV